MASRSGTRPQGTDGNDFTHREKVDPRYAISAETKKLVKYSIYMQFFISVIVQLQLIFYYGAKIGGMSEMLPEVPTPQFWQFFWLSSLVPAIAGYMSLNRNRLTLLSIYYKGTVSLGIGTILITMFINCQALLEYASTKNTSTLFHGFPVIVFWFIYLFIAIQIQAFGIYNARILMKTWAEPKKKN